MISFCTLLGKCLFSSSKKEGQLTARMKVSDVTLRVYVRESNILSPQNAPNLKNKMVSDSTARLVDSAADCAA